MLVQQKQILLVDADRDTCEMMTLFLGLSHYNYKVRFAQTMAAGWRMARDRYFDLCLLDSRLPDGSGYELCRRIHDMAPELPVVFYSGDAYDIHRQQGLAAGAQAYLVKPNDLDRIADVIGELIAEGRESLRQVGISPSEREENIKINQLGQAGVCDWLGMVAF